VGAAELDHDSGSAAELVEAADTALRRAKGSATFDVPRIRR
jgi:PleD family two-component response regulator